MNERGAVYMHRFRKILCVLLVAILLMPLSVAAETTDQKDYPDLFLNGTRGELITAFLQDPRSFVSALSKEKYGRMITVVSWVFDPYEAEKNGDTYRQILLTLAQENELNQAERRVVRWMLDRFDTPYYMWTAELDYRELFSRCAEMDGALPAYYAKELREVFFMDPYRFLQEMSDSNANLERLSEILMDRIYYGNYDRQEVDKLLQSMENSGKLNDAQLQMLQKLWDAVDYLIDLYGPLPERPVEEPDVPQTDPPTEPTEPTKPTKPTEPAPKEPDKKIWLWTCVGIGVLLIAVIVVVYIRRRKA